MKSLKNLYLITRNLHRKAQEEDQIENLDLSEEKVEKEKIQRQTMFQMQVKA